jgi:hypothetical protein
MRIPIKKQGYAWAAPEAGRPVCKACPRPDKDSDFSLEGSEVRQKMLRCTKTTWPKNFAQRHTAKPSSPALDKKSPGKTGALANQ